MVKGMCLASGCEEAVDAENGEYRCREHRKKILTKAFPICSVCREDVVYAYKEHFKMTQKQAEKKALAMDDSDMETLARKMSDAFSNTDTYQMALELWLEEIQDE
jgi:hypothetical protein